jgi:hypothetical protein
MIKKVNFSQFPFKITRIILFMFLLILAACKKNNTPSMQAIEYENWFSQNKQAAHTSAFDDLKPIWESAYINEQGDIQVHEISLSNPKNVYQRTDTKIENKLAHLRNNIRLLIFKDKTTGKIITGCYMSIVDEGAQLTNLTNIHYKRPNELSGKIMFFNMLGNLENGWEYNKGTITKRINGTINGYYYGSKNTLSDLTNPALVGNINSGLNKLMTYSPPTCAFPQPDYKRSCVGVDGYMECTTYLAGYTCNEGGSDGTGGYYNPYPVNPGPGGGGGSTVPSVIASELNTDSIEVKFPCASKLILRPIFNLEPMNDFVKPFLAAQRPTISYKTANLTWSDATTGGLFELGNTIYDPNSGLNRSTIVTLNEKMLQNSSPLLIASTTIHETIHSYIYYNVSVAEYDVKTNYNDNSNWMVSLNGFYLIKDLPSNYSNHTMMLTSYFDKAVAVLKAWDATQATHYSDKQLAMAMLYGLNTVDPGTSQSLLDNINSVFQSLKTKYGITDAQLATFNRENLNSVGKLPTTGCN